MKTSVVGFKSFVKEFIMRFKEHDVLQVGGQIAYFTILSVFPFLIYINELIVSVNLTRNSVAETLAPFVSAEFLQFAIGYIENLNSGSAAGAVPVSIIITIFSASRVLRSMESAVNKAYNTTKRRGYIKSVIYSMIFTLCMGIAFLLAILLVVASDKVIAVLFSLFNIPSDYIGITMLIKWVAALVLVCGLIAVVYYILPNKKIKFRSTFPGAVIATVGIGLMSAGVGFYTSNFEHYSLIYGSIGTVFLVLIWAYFAGTILVSGAEINCMLSEKTENSNKEDE